MSGASLVTAPLVELSRLVPDAAELMGSVAEPRGLILASKNFLDLSRPQFLDERDRLAFLGQRPKLERYPVPRSPVRLDVVADVRVIGPKFVVVDGQRRTYPETYWSEEHLDDRIWFRSLPSSAPGSARRFECLNNTVDATFPEAFLVGTPWSHNYHHWLLECLASVWLREHLSASRDVPILVPRPLIPFQEETLDRLGILPEQRIGHAGVTAVEKLWIPSRGDFYLPTLRWLRQRLLDSIAGADGDTCGTGESGRPKRIYLSRSDATSRRILNEDVLTRRLEQRDFVVETLEGKSIAEQIRLFSGAEWILGPHGAGLTNALFAPPGSWLIELHPGDVVNHVFWLLAGGMGLRYAFLAGSLPTGPRDFSIDVDRVERLLDQIEKPRESEQKPIKEPTMGRPSPSSSEAADRFRQATTAHQAGRLDEAERYYRAILKIQPSHVDALQLLAVVLASTDRVDEGVPHLERAIQLGGENPPLVNNLAEMKRRQGKLSEARDLFRKVIRTAPTFAEGYFNLGNVLRQLGEDGGTAAFRRALELQPNHPKARFNLANALREEGRVPVAVREYEQIVHQNPAWYEPRLNFGAALAELGRTDEALVQYGHAARLKPEDTIVHGNIADVHVKRGEVAKAREHYARAYPEVGPNSIRSLRVEALCEPIMPDNAAIDAFRERLLQHVEHLTEAAEPFDLAGLSRCGAEPPMLLAYQGREERPIREAYGRLFAPRIPTFDPLAGSGDGPPHVGVVVTHGHEGVFARCLGALLKRIDRSRLRLSLCCSEAGKNILMHVFGHTEERFVLLPQEIDAAAEALRAERFDLLHYWEIGTDAMNYFLPYFRPAPRQSTTWGWPVTTGNPHVDYFVAAKGLEPEDGQSHYGEKLVLLDSQATYYERPPVPKLLKPRESFGLPATGRVYLCVQNLRKVHPDMDPWLVGLAEADPEGTLVFLADEQPTVTRLLQDRWAKYPALVGRTRVLNRLEREAYLNVLATADVGIDTPHYGGGANTVYDSLATGTPTVTLPGLYHRGRFGATVYRSLGLEELVAADAADYLQKATAIARNADHRRALHQQMLAGSEAVFEDLAAVRAYEDFFLTACARR